MLPGREPQVLAAAFGVPDESLRTDELAHHDVGAETSTESSEGRLAHSGLRCQVERRAPVAEEREEIGSHEPKVGGGLRLVKPPGGAEDRTPPAFDSGGAIGMFKFCAREIPRRWDFVAAWGTRAYDDNPAPEAAG